MSTGAAFCVVWERGVEELVRRSGVTGARPP